MRRVVVGTLIIWATILLSGCDRMKGAVIEGGRKIEQGGAKVLAFVNHDKNVAIAACEKAVDSAYADIGAFVWEVKVVGYLKYRIIFWTKSQHALECNTDNGVVTGVSFL